MTEKVTNELLYEVLKDMQNRIGRVEHKVDEVQSSLVSMRDAMHIMMGDGLRREKHIALVENRLDRIETRLNLTDVEQ